jgi:alpha-L-arabinofuranosidase
MKIAHTTLSVFALWLCSQLTIMSADGPEGAGHEYDGVIIEQDKIDGQAKSPVSMTIDPSKKTNVYSSRLFGYNDGWITTNYLQNVFKTETLDSSLVPVNDGYLRVLADIPLPLTRMAGTESKYLQWKKAIGPASQREQQKIVWASTKVLYGPVEWIHNSRKLHPDAEFVWVVNMNNDTSEDARDLAEFFTGGTDTVWGKKRIECGLEKPMKPAIWELGNELDLGNEISIDEYIKRCRTYIQAIRSVQPDAVFAASARSSPWSPVRAKNWKEWHRKVLAELGSDIQYLVFHPYYRGMAPKGLIPYLDTISKDIRDSSNQNIKLYLSEHSVWPLVGKSGSEEWKNSLPNGRTLKSCLNTSEWLILMLHYPMVKAMSYHCLTGGCAWGVIQYDKASDQYFPTGIADMFKLFAAVPYGSDVVSSSMTGAETDWRKNDFSFVSAAVTSTDGKKLYLLLDNRLPETSRKLTVSIAGDKKYRLTQTMVLTAPSLDSIDTATERPISLTTTVTTDAGSFTGCTIPAKTLELLTLEKDPD